MATYTETKATLDLIAVRSENNRTRLERARDLISLALTDLTSMASDYSAFKNQLVIDVAANPVDPAWIAAGAEIDEMIADFQALKARATLFDTAVTGL